MTVDSLCVTSWRARPVSFVGLMTLYESNYIRLRGLTGDVRSLAGRIVSTAPSDCDLHLEIVEHSPYTSVLRLTYLFDDAAGQVADPDLEVRVYHDARLAEASRCARWVRHPGLASIRSRVSMTLGERWLRNMLLNKWLDYCVDRGHRFAGRRPSRALRCMRLRDEARRLIQRLAGRRPSAEDERLVALFRNRAELKKELGALDDERHRLLDRLKLQEGATMRVEEQFAALEQYLGRAEEGYKSLAYFQLKGLWRAAAKRLEQFAAELTRQQKDRERRQQLAEFDRAKRARLADVDRELVEARVLADQLQAEQKLGTQRMNELRGFWNYFRRTKARGDAGDAGAATRGGADGRHGPQRRAA